MRKFVQSSMNPGSMSIAHANTAHWFMDGRQRILTSTFEDPYFREMLAGFFEAGGGSLECKYLTRKRLSYYIRGEFELFKIYLRRVIFRARDAAEGNRFAQGLHDRGTISDKQKRLAVGIQFIDTEWEKNHVVCIGMSPPSNASAGPTAELLRTLSEERMGVGFDKTVASFKQYKATAAVAKAMEYEVDNCDMHQTSKMSESAVGSLVRKKKQIINRFSEGEEVIRVAHVMGKFFSYSSRNEELAECSRAVASAVLRIKLDVNGTRLTAKHGLLHSILRLNKALNLLQIKSDVEWAGAGVKRLGEYTIF